MFVFVIMMILNELFGETSWLDGEDLYMDKESIEPPSQAGDKIELK